MNEQYFKNKTIIVTGASSGIGKCLTEKLAAIGDNNLILVSRNEEKLKEIKERLKYINDNIHVYKTDISKLDDIKKLYDSISKDFENVDILFNNAGVAYYKKLSEMEDEKISNIIDVNLKGLIFLTKYVLKIMLKKNTGQIVNINSVVGKRGYPLISVYSATKGGLNQFSESLRQELKETKICLTEIFPEATKTEFVESSGVLKEGVVKSTEGMAEPELVAKEILNQTSLKTREYIFGLKGNLLKYLNVIIPRFLDKHL